MAISQSPELQCTQIGGKLWMSPLLALVPAPAYALLAGGFSRIRAVAEPVLKVDLSTQNVPKNSGFRPRGERPTAANG
ncbi:hypothetical protein DENSPDRAFT_934351 [Dentipellis sp. KUC8613]|nr:hypothetical protein DENSPDRAFT_934351 [Dentipellis sp. KUC8613]